MTGVRAPVRDGSGEVVAALGVAALAERVGPAAEAEIVAKVVATAAAIGDRLATVAC
ncbi:hypothetical protein [Streptomyces sp. NPDC001537]